MNQPLQSMAPAVDLDAVKLKQQAAWSSGDFAVIGTTLQIVGESLAEAVDICADEAVLDVAAGNGNASLAAARRFASVISTDYVPELLLKGRHRASAEGLHIQFRTADVENLPFEDASFDVVLSTFGCMFAPDHQRTADEMLRVLVSGGRIGMANWTPDSFIGELFKVIGAFLPPAPGLRSPALWGTESYLVELFGTRVASLVARKQTFNFRYRSAAHWIQVFRDFYGPTHKAFAALDATRQGELERAITELLMRFNVAGDRSLVVPSEYLEVVATKL